MSEYYSSGVINIPNVTGNIVITATAAAAPLTSITATYTQSGTVYDTDTLDSLKADLVVTAYYDNGTSATVTTYTLSGTLAEGTSTITVSYGGKTTTFNVVVSPFVNGLVNGTYTLNNVSGGTIGAIVTDTNHVTYGDSITSYSWVTVPLKKPVSVHNGDVFRLTLSVDAIIDTGKAVEPSVDGNATRKMLFYFTSQTSVTKSTTATSDYTMEAIGFYTYTQLRGMDFYVSRLTINDEVII